MKRLILILLLSWPIWALDPDPPALQYLVDKWDTGKGLPANTVTSLSQTPDGYLWLATSKGLARFDGVKFTIIPFFQKNENEPLETIQPDVLFLDKSDILWIGTAKSLTSYDYRTGRFRTFTRTEGMQGEGIRRISCDMGGNLWVSFWVNGVARFSKGTFTYFDAPQGLEGKRINAIIEDQKGNLLFGARDKGVFIFKDGKFSPYPVKELENLQVIDMKEDRKGNLWIGTTQGLFKVNGPNITRYTTGSGLSDDNVRSILEDSERNLWVGTDKGLNRLKYFGDGNIPTIESFLPSSMVIALFEDREKNLWVGTNNEELKQIKDSKFMSYKPLEPYKEEIILSLFESRDKNTWIGTINGKLFHMRGRGAVEVLEPQELKGAGIAAITEDSEGNLWLGTIDKGVFQRKNDIYNHYTTENGLSDNTVTSIYQDSKHDLWFSTFNGVTIFRYQNRVFEMFTSGDGLPGKMVNNVYEDKAGNIWIAADKGLTILPKAFVGGPYRRGRFSRKEPPWPPEAIFKDISITCIYEDPEVPGVYWVATNEAGLKRLTIKDGNLISCTSYTTDEGMTTNSIFQFLEDNEGWFWLMSDSGVLRINKNELNRFAGKESNNIYCASFGTADGMQSIGASNKLSKNSVLKAWNGELWFLTDKGIAIVNPGKIRINKTAPPVEIEAIFINQSNIALRSGADAYIFKGNSDFSVQFTAPTFLSPEKVKFKYRLQGFDKDWVTLAAGKERTAFYKNLGPGTYVFRVTACNADGVWNQTGDAIAFTIKPNFHQTLFFKILLLFMLAILAAAVFFLYKKRPFTVNNNNNNNKEEKKRSPLDSQLADECAAKLTHLMEKEKVYRDEKISLQTLAEKVSTTPHILSQVLNERLNRNFSDFINSYRVEEARKIFESPRGAEKKNSTIAGDVGFNNLGVFYKAFKKFTGMTPNEYKKNQATDEHGQTRTFSR